MKKVITLPAPKVHWAIHKTNRSPKKPIPASEILNDKQMMKYQNSTDKQRAWLDEFLRTGDSDWSARIAYPTATVGSVYQLSLRGRVKFDLNKKDLEKFMKENPNF